VLKGGHMATIALIDDEDLFRNSIKMMLEKRGHTILEADNGKDGVALVKQNIDNIDIVLIDVVMPNKGGVESLMELKQKLSRKVIIVMTGKVTPDSDAFRRLVETLGVMKVLYKPFKKKELLEIIDSI
jgi:DNA-binding response OmpR family regulator